MENRSGHTLGNEDDRLIMLVDRRGMERLSKMRKHRDRGSIRLAATVDGMHARADPEFQDAIIISRIAKRRPHTGECHSGLAGAATPDQQYATHLGAHRGAVQELQSEPRRPPVQNATEGCALFPGRELCDIGRPEQRKTTPQVVSLQSALLDFPSNSHWTIDVFKPTTARLSDRLRRANTA